MSTDLEFCQDLQKFRLPTIKIQIQQQSSSNSTEDIGSIIDKQENNDSNECQTPTSKEHKIPAILCCPPAPRKPRRTVSCKRKLQFFEILNHEEVDNFFRSSFDLVAKKRCMNM